MRSKIWGLLLGLVVATSLPDQSRAEIAGKPGAADLTIAAGGQSAGHRGRCG